jgi:hypothetical protein
MYLIGQFGALGPIYFAEIPLDPVAHHRVADFTRYGESKLTSLTFPPGYKTDERGTHVAAAILAGGPIIASAGEAFPSRVRIQARHNRLITSKSLCSQALASSTTTPAHYVASAHRGHARTEAMIPLPLQI